jgi:hypothetical protein
MAMNRPSSLTTSKPWVRETGAISSFGFRCANSCGQSVQRDEAVSSAASLGDRHWDADERPRPVEELAVVAELRDRQPTSSLEAQPAAASIALQRQRLQSIVDDWSAMTDEERCACCR